MNFDFNVQLDEAGALALAEGKVRGDIGGRWKIHEQPHSVAGNDDGEKGALRLAEGMEGTREKAQIAAGHATAIAARESKRRDERVTIQSKWGPLSAAHGGRRVREQQLRLLLARAAMETGERFALKVSYLSQDKFWFED